MFSPTVALTVALAVGVLFFIGLIVVGIMRSGEMASTATSTSVETTTSTVATGAVRPEPAEPVGPRRLQPTSVIVSSQLSDEHGPDNLFDGDPDTAWRDAGLHGEGAVLAFRFDTPVEVGAVVISGIGDDEEFHRSFRIRDLRLGFGEAGEPREAELPDSPEPYRIDLGGVATDVITLEVLTTYPAEGRGDEPPAEELAVSEVEILGRPGR